MASWYEKAVFYHIYPLGMLGAPFANTEDAAADRFPELDKWVAHMEALGCTALYIGPLFESPPMATIPEIISLWTAGLAPMRTSGTSQSSAMKPESRWS